MVIMQLNIIMARILLIVVQTQCHDRYDSDLDTLLSTHIIMRHAARATALIELASYPLYPYWNDPTRWPNGYSQLTDIGIRQAINTGKYIKQRYNGFIPKDPKNAILRCTNIDRNRDTAELMGKIIWPINKNRINSMSPRIFSKPFPLDPLYSDPYCPYLSQGLLDSPELREINDKYQFVYDLVGNHTGIAKNIYGVAGYFGYLYQTDFNGYARPDWVTDYYYDLMEKIDFKYFNLWFSGLALKLKIGKFLEELKDRMDKVIYPDCDADPWYKNFFIYVAHHYEVYTTIKAMGHDPNQIIQYCSMVIFELHRINGDLKVKVFHINDTITPPFRGYQLKPSFCPEYDCPYETFISNIQLLIPNNWREDCGISKDLDIYPMLEKWQTITNENIRPEGTIYTSVNKTSK